MMIFGFVIVVALTAAWAGGYLVGYRVAEWRRRPRDRWSLYWDERGPRQ